VNRFSPQRLAGKVYEALTDAGFNDAQIVDLCFGWYAAVPGHAYMAETMLDGIVAQAR
jgi:alkylhydroperoxidase family enzyme